jgi:nicotinamide-nucleotide amidase
MTAEVHSAADLLTRLSRRGWTIAAAESLTGGLLAASIISVPGASATMRGAVVAYATDLKRTLLGVDAELLAREGAVHPEVARQMARGVRARLGADVGLATTGVAGPDPQDERPVGTVHVAVETPESSRVASLRLTGTRADIRAAAVEAVVALALEAV